MEIQVPVYVKRCIELLKQDGYEAFVVGGCVRDSILGRIPNDWDVCTSAEPNDTKRVLGNYKTIDIGIKHGTVGVIIDNQKVEITTYRIDGEYSDGRRPDMVEYTKNLKDDLRRRDFTINALAYNEDIGIIDYFNGLKDLKEKRIKCVGNPEERFHEDALRIMRAVRFSSQLSYDIEHNTLAAIKKKKHLINKISVERIREEFNKLLLSENPTLGMKLILDMNLLSEFLPLMQWNTDKDEWMLYCENLNKCKGNLVLALTHTIKYIFGEENFEALGEKFLRDLKFDNASIKRVKELLFYSDKEIPQDKTYLKGLMSKITEEGLQDLIKLKELSGVKELIDDIKKNKEPYRIKDLKISGEDLLKIGIPRGKIIGEILDYLLQEVIKEPNKNNNVYLQKEALRFYGK